MKILLDHIIFFQRITKRISIKNSNSKNSNIYMNKCADIRNWCEWRRSSGKKRAKNDFSVKDHEKSTKRIYIFLKRPTISLLWHTNPSKYTLQNHSLRLTPPLDTTPTTFYSYIKWVGVWTTLSIFFLTRTMNEIETEKYSTINRIIHPRENHRPSWKG